MRAHTEADRPLGVRQVGGYENVPRLCCAPRSCPPPGRGAHSRTEGRIRGPEGGEEGWVPRTPIYRYVALRLATDFFFFSTRFLPGT